MTQFNFTHRADFIWRKAETIEVSCCYNIYKNMILPETELKRVNNIKDISINQNTGRYLIPIRKHFRQG